jgi:hypothetical protein
MTLPRGTGTDKPKRVECKALVTTNRGHHPLCPAFASTSATAAQERGFPGPRPLLVSTTATSHAGTGGAALSDRMTRRP